MENNNTVVSPTTVQTHLNTDPLFKVTPLSKYFAMVIFIILPFLGFWIGMQYGSQTAIPAVISVPSAPDKTTPTESLPTTNVEAMIPIKSSSTQPHLRATVTVNTDYETTGGYSLPRSEIYLIDAHGSSTTLAEVHGACQVDGGSGRISAERLRDTLGDEAEIISHVGCWWAGSGYDAYLYQKATNPTEYQVMGFETYECGAVPDCLGFEAPQLLITIVQ